MPAAVIEQNQRERLLSAAVDALAENGYAQLSVEHIVSGAGVSRSTFYEHFQNKSHCIEVAHERAFDQLMSTIFRVCAAERDWPAKVAAGLDAAIEFAMTRPLVARLLVLDAVGADQALASRVHASEEHLAGLLRAGREYGPNAAGMPAITERAMIGGATSIIGSRLMADEADRLPELRSQLLELMLTPYIGAEEARRVAV